MSHSVYDFMSRSSTATVLARMDLGEGCKVAIWQNHNDRMQYEAPRDHAFSLYLEGGTGVRRIDKMSKIGFPGAVCVIPQGCDSQWEITTPFRFVHLYLSDTRLRSGYARARDCDARQLNLPEASFITDPHLAAPLAQLASAAGSHDVLLAESAIAEIYGALKTKPVAVFGGLAPHVLRRTDEWIESHLDQTIHLDDLARLADLSDFHFHRMFRLSRGIAPYAWVTGRRIERAQALLRSGLPIAEIAVACGFSSQSHLTRVFRRWTGRPPAEYRSVSR
jgi:AraC family transcriptional regulator